MKISNKTKYYIKIVVVLIIVAWILSGAIYYVTTLFAEINDITISNKYHTEKIVLQEIRYNQMWEYTEKMSNEEWEKTFLGD